MLQGHVLRGPGAGGGPEAHDEGVRRLYTRFIMMCLCYRDMFCAGRVPEEDLKRTMKACGGSIHGLL